MCCSDVSAVLPFRKRRRRMRKRKRERRGKLQLTRVDWSLRLRGKGWGQ